MSLKPAKVQFNGGELSPWLEARTDISKFDKTAKLCRNFIPLAEGSLKRRGGSRFISFTPKDEELSFKIKAVPLEAEIIINGTYCNSIKVARGEWVSYEVKAEGYVSKSDKVFVEEDTEIEVVLVSVGEMVELVINPIPENAVVKIEGYERKRASFYKNSEVFYVVSCDGYEMKSGKVKLTNNMVIDVELEKIEESEYNGSYGDWGQPIEMISCSAVYNISVQKKCFLIRFEYGYLPIIFGAGQKGPNAEDIEKSKFIYEQRDGGDSIVERDEEYILCSMKPISNGILYYDFDGNAVAGVTVVEQKTFGWQVDENGRYASFYNTYSASVIGNVIKAFYKDEVIFVLEGRF